MSMTDVLYAATTLKIQSVDRVKFDPSNKEHLLSLKTFLQKGSWGNLQFKIEHPYNSVIDSVLRNLANYYIQTHEN